MLIDFIQNRDSVELSYVGDNGKIEVEEIIMEPGSTTNGFFKIVETSEDDPDCLDDLVSFFGHPVKKQPSHNFSGMNINEFISETLKSLKPDLYNNIRKLIEPLPYSVDIETDITDEYGYSTAEKAENRVLSISVTNNRLDTILFLTKNSKYYIPDDGLVEEDKLYIDAILQEALGKYYNFGGEKRNRPVQYKVKVFETETEMLSAFIISIHRYFHLIFGWNFYDYDQTYMYNRSRQKGLDWKKASPVNSMSEPKKSINLALEVPIEYPRHRMCIDYMKLFKQSENYHTMTSFSLNSCAEEVLGLQKVDYEGNLRTLYNKDYLRFIAYALVDTIIVMLLHNETNMLSTYFFQSYYTELPYTKLNQNPISSSLIYKELRKKGKFICDNEMPPKIHRKYIGAFVKLPIVHDILACMGEDFGSLYPNSMISCYLSFDNKVNDTIQMDEFGHPINKFNQDKFDRYIAENCCITPMGRIYRCDENNVYTLIEIGLIAERKIFKNAKEDVYINIMPKLQAEIDKRLNQK